MDIFHALLQAIGQTFSILLISISGFFGAINSHTVFVAPPSAQTTNLPIVPAKQKVVREASGSVLPLEGRRGPSELGGQLSAQQTVQQPLLPAANPDRVNADTRAALVNILCLTGGGGYFKPISGSGAFIDSRGIILTNAHIGQFFLLRDFPVKDNVTCTIRTGSPAQNTYTARLLYLPPVWIDANAKQITSQEAMGTGENDFALLLVTGSTDPNKQTTCPVASCGMGFPALQMTTDDPRVGDGVLLAAYPAGFLDGQTIEMNLFAASTFTNIGQIFVFDKADGVDLVSVGGTPVSQAGSSGGAVVRTQDGSLTGIIVTATASSTTSGRDLRAITIGHINRSLQAGLGGIATFLSGNINALADTFNREIAPLLTQKLIAVLKK